MDRLWLDLKYALRRLARSPGFTFVAVVSLALAIGANSAVFSLVDRVLLARLPVRDPGGLVLLGWVGDENPALRSLMGWFEGTPQGNRSTSFSLPAFHELRDHNRTLSTLFAFSEEPRLNVAVDGRGELATGQVVSGGYFAGMGVGAHLGRVLTPADDRPDAPLAVVLTHAYWQRRFGGDPEVVGRRISIDIQPFTVVGVAPPGFRGSLQVDSSPDLFLTLAADARAVPGTGDLADPGSWWLQLMGRLAPGVSRAEARADLDTLLSRVIAEGAAGKTPSKAGSDDEAKLPHVVLASGARGLNQVRHTMIEPLAVAQSVCLVILAIACVNLANLLLARAGARRREVAVRLSLGAGRRLLVRQLLTEVTVLAAAGGVLGFLLAEAGAGALVALLAPGNEIGPGVAPAFDWRVVAFTAVLTVGTGLLFGLVPSLRASRADLSPALSEGSAGAGQRRGQRLTGTLLVVQVALSVALLAVTGLFAETLRNLERVDLGFQPNGLAVFRIDPSLDGYQGERLAGLYRQILEGLRALPGVRSAALTKHPPLAGVGWYANAGVVSPREGEPDHVGAYVAPCDPAFLDTLGIPIVLGRGFRPEDGPGAPHVAVVSEAMARKAFGDASPLGRRLALHGDGTEVEIVGVARNSRTQSLREDRSAPALYLPYTQSLDAMDSATFLVRTDQDPASTLKAARRLVRRIDPGLSLFDAGTLAHQVRRSLSQERQLSHLSGLSSLLALFLASLGVYGLLSYAVAGRRREIGIRMALGADRRRVVRLVLRELVRVALGAAVGVAVALGVGRWLESLLYGLEPGNGAVLAAAVAVMMAVAAFAAYLPARRAARLDPAEVLRTE